MKLFLVLRVVKDYHVSVLESMSSIKVLNFVEVVLRESSCEVLLHSDWFFLRQRYLVKKVFEELLGHKIVEEDSGQFQKSFRFSSFLFLHGSLRNSTENFLTKHLWRSSSFLMKILFIC